MKNKKAKTILITIAVIVGIFVIIFAILMIKRTTQKKAVNVYSVAAVSTEDFESSTSSSYGEVRSDGFQNISVSDTMTINNIFVMEGQEVKAGDPILSYDTTLSDLDVEKADLNLQKLNLSLDRAQRELNTINSLVPHYEVLIQPDNSDISYTPVTTPFLMSGTGTADDPMYWLIDDSNTFNRDFFTQLLPEGSSNVYVVLLTREYTAVNGQIQSAIGLNIQLAENDFAIRPFEVFIPAEIDEFDTPEEPYYEQYGSDYSAAEIAQMRTEKEAEIKDLEVQVKVASLELEKKKKEIANDTETAKEDGFVRTIRNPDEAYREGKPVVEISAGGGYYIDVYLNELELDKVNVGDTVTVNTYNSGVTCEGEIKKISILPSQSGQNDSMGNPNVSYYPFVVFVPDDAGLMDGEYASVTYSALDMTDDSFYLDNMFIRKENGESYVYSVSEQNTLEKRYIKTGKSLWGAYTQIKEGLTRDDRVAFPYGKDLQDGAEVNDADLSELYNY